MNDLKSIFPGWCLDARASTAAPWMPCSLARDSGKSPGYQAVLCGSPYCFLAHRKLLAHTVLWYFKKFNLKSVFYFYIKQESCSSSLSSTKFAI